MPTDLPTRDDVGLIRVFVHAESAKRSDDDIAALHLLHDYFYPLAWACYDPSILPHLDADHTHPRSDGRDAYSWGVDVEMSVAEWDRVAARYGIALVPGSPVPAEHARRTIIEAEDGDIPAIVVESVYEHPDVRVQFAVAFAVEVDDVRD